MHRTKDPEDRDGAHRDAANAPVNGRVLVVDDDEGMCELIQLGLRKRGFEVSWRTRASEALDLAKREDFDVVVTDLRMDEMSGLEVCQRLSAVRPGVPVVMVTGRGGVEAVVSAMRVGVYDYITKPVDMKLLTVAIRRAVNHRRLRREVNRLRQVVGERAGAGAILGESQAIQQSARPHRAGGSQRCVGARHGRKRYRKKFVAREVHECSERSDGPFVAINCAGRARIPAGERAFWTHARVRSPMPRLRAPVSSWRPMGNALSR